MLIYEVVLNLTTVLGETGQLVAAYLFALVPEPQTHTEFSMNQSWSRGGPDSGRRAADGVAGARTPCPPQTCSLVALVCLGQ